MAAAASGIKVNGLLCAAQNDDEARSVPGHGQGEKARRITKITLLSDPEMPGAEPHSSQGEPGFSLPWLSRGQGGCSRWCQFYS